MIELYPEGFEEVERRSGVELVAYTDAAGEERMWHVFGDGRRDRRRGGLGGPLAHLPSPGARRPALGRAALGDGRRTTPSRSSSTPAAHSAPAPIRRRSSAWSCSRSSSRARCSTSAAAPASSRSPPRCSASRRCSAVDIEAPSIVATLENAERNSVELDARVVKGDEPLTAAHAAVANISIGAVLALPARLDAEPRC